MSADLHHQVEHTLPYIAFDDVRRINVDDRAAKSSSSRKRQSNVGSPMELGRTSIDLGDSTGLELVDQLAAAHHNSERSIASIESINRDSCWYVPQEYTITHGRKQALARGIDGNHAPELFIISQQRIDVLCPQADLLGVHGVEAHDGGGGGEEAAGDE